MLQQLKPAGWMALTFICITGAASIAWQKMPAPLGTTPTQEDTVPKKQRVKGDETIINGSLDKALEDVQKAQESLRTQLEGRDWEKVQQDMLKAQQELSAINIHDQIENAVKNINLQQIQVETQAALQKINWEKMQQNMQRAQEGLKNSIDSKKIDREIQRAMEETKKAMTELKAVDMEKIQAQLEKTKSSLAHNEIKMQESIEKARKEIGENMHLDIKKEMEHAREEVEHAKASIRNYKEMLDEMEKDGLLHSKESYSIEYNKGELLIDGKKQPDNVTSKYNHYFKKDKVTLKKDSNEEESRIIHL